MLYNQPINKVGSDVLPVDRLAVYKSHSSSTPLKGHVISKTPGHRKSCVDFWWKRCGVEQRALKGIRYGFLVLICFPNPDLSPCGSALGLDRPVWPNLGRQHLSQTDNADIFAVSCLSLSGCCREVPSTLHFATNLNNIIMYCVTRHRKKSKNCCF